MSDLAVDSPDRSIRAKKYSLWTLVELLLAGLALGLVGAFLQAVEVTIGPISVPLWMILILAGMLATARALTLHYESRKPAVFWFLGWIAATLVLSLPLPGGDQVISDGIVQAVYVFGGAVLGGAFISVPAGLRSAERTEYSHPAESSDESAGARAVGEAS